MKKIEICENHDMSLKIWRDRGFKDAVVIHVDTHIDFTAPSECFYITIANYLNYAYEEGIIKYIIWVIPDNSFNDKSSMDDIIQEISYFFRLKFISQREFIFQLIGKEDFSLCITTLQYIDKLDLIEDGKDILLDIDCDFFMNPMIKSTYSYIFPEKCWIKCENFCEKMCYIYNKCSLTTISISIIGGYTPLLFSFLCKQIEEIFLYKKNTYVQLEKAIEIMSAYPKEALKIFSNIPESMDKKRESYRLLGITYCHMLEGNYIEAGRGYEKLFSEKKQYERYFLPVHGLLKEQVYLRAEMLIDMWLNVAPYSQVAICYKVRVELVKERPNYNQLEMLLDMLTDEGTFYEKTYLGMLFYMKIERYTQAIDSGLRVINFLLQNITPEWVDQISSFENHKNHGIIIAKVYNYISLSYLQLGERNEAVKYAKICKIMGFPVEFI